MIASAEPGCMCEVLASEANPGWGPQISWAASLPPEAVRQRPTSSNLPWGQWRKRSAPIQWSSIFRSRRANRVLLPRATAGGRIFLSNGLATACANWL